MRVSRVRRIPVIDEKGALVGIVSINDLARAAERESVMSGLPTVTLSEVAGTLAAICTPRTKVETPMECHSAMRPLIIGSGDWFWHETVAPKERQFESEQKEIVSRGERL